MSNPMNEKKSCILYFSYATQFNRLTNEELGILMRGFMQYATTGIEPKLDGAVGMAFSFMKDNLDRDNEKWDEIRNKRSAAGKKSAESRARAKLEREQAAQGKPPVKAGEPFFTPTNYEEPKQTQGYSTYNQSYSNPTPAVQQSARNVLSTENASYLQHFWTSYPKQQNYEAVRNWFAENPLTESQYREIVDGLENHKMSEQWGKEQGRYIPQPANWLQKRKWVERFNNTIVPLTKSIYTQYCEDNDAWATLDEPL